MPTETKARSPEWLVEVLDRARRCGCPECVRVLEAAQTARREERARGAVVRDRLMVASAWIDDRVAPWGYTDADAREFNRDRDHVVELARQALSDPSQAVTALLELAEASPELLAAYQVACRLTEAEDSDVDPETGHPLDPRYIKARAAVGRWREVSR